MAETMFCSVDDVKRTFKVAGGVVAHDDLLSDIIPTVTRNIQDATRREWIYGTYTQYFPTSGSMTDGRLPKFFLKEMKFDFSVPSYAYYDYYGRFQDLSPLAYNTNYYIMDDSPGQRSPRLVIDLATDATENGFKLVYNAGYVKDETSGLVLVPDHIKRATALQTAFIARREIENNSGIEKEKKGDNEITYAASAEYMFIPEVKRLLVASKRQLVGWGM